VASAVHWQQIKIKIITSIDVVRKSCNTQSNKVVTRNCPKKEPKLSK